MNVNNGIKTAIATTPDQARGFINRYSGDHNLSTTYQIRSG